MHQVPRDLGEVGARIRSESPAVPGHLPALVLASGSPRRRELLAGLGLAFTVRPVDLDESPLPGEEPGATVIRLADAKAAAGGRPGELALGADTLVVLDGTVLGKPRDAAEAAAMLLRIAGREHTVLTGVALCERASTGVDRKVAAIETSRVRMAPLTPDEAAWYVATGEPLDKAGAYAVQGLGALFVEAVFGNYTNVVGLPLPATARLFRELGYDLLDFRA
jgi:septum formation protein